MCQQRQSRRRLLASKHQCKQCLFTCFMRNEIYSMFAGHTAFWQYDFHFNRILCRLNTPNRVKSLLNLVMSLMRSQLSRAGKHGQQVTVVGQIFHCAAPQSCSTLSVFKSVLREDVWGVGVLRRPLPRLIVLQGHTGQVWHRQTTLHCFGITVTCFWWVKIN